MFDKIPVPVKGQPARASWGAGVTNRVNELCSMVPSRGLARDGLTGTGFAPLPANLRDRKPAAARPRQFDLRARVESRGEDDSKEYRLVVEFWHAFDFGDHAVVLSRFGVPYLGSVLYGWNEIYASEWSSSLTESKDYFLNVSMAAELEEDGRWPRGFVVNDTHWWISDEPVQTYHKTEGNMAIFRNAYPLAHVAASGSSASVTQRFDGPLTFLDFVELGRGGGGGSFDDNKSSKAGRYAIVSIEHAFVTMRNPYFSVGGKTYMGGVTTATLIGGETNIVALRISATGDSAPVSTIEVYESVAALQAAQNSLEYYTIPLYMVSTTLDEETGDVTYSVVCDFRIGPDAAMGEF